MIDFYTQQATKTIDKLSTLAPIIFNDTDYYQLF